MREKLPIILGILTGILCVVVLVAIFAGDGKEKKSDDLYYDKDLKIVSINGETSVSESKITHPKECNYILFETLGEEKLYMELNTCELDDGCSCNKIHIDRKWIYSHCAGDIVHFDYIAKERFFKIHKDEHYQ